jgi:hypothetical protein
MEQDSVMSAVTYSPECWWLELEMQAKLELRAPGFR